MGKRYIFLADGFEEIEGLTVVDLLRRAKMDIATVSITDSLTVTGSHGITVLADQRFGESDFTEGELFVLPGGMPGTKNLGAHKGLGALLEDMHRKNRGIAAICAAPSILGDLGLLNGREAVCYPGFERRLVGARVSPKPVVRDGNITTARGMGCAILFALSLIEQSRGTEEAGRIAESIIYQ